jgi:hypothetical protein
VVPPAGASGASPTSTAATPVARTAEATVYDGWLAVHPTLYGPPDAPANPRSGWANWTITHLPTSGWLAQFRHQRFAKKCAEELALAIERFERDPGEEALWSVHSICLRHLHQEAEELLNGS